MIALIGYELAIIFISATKDSTLNKFYLGNIFTLRTPFIDIFKHAVF